METNNVVSRRASRHDSRRTGFSCIPKIKDTFLWHTYRTGSSVTRFSHHCIAFAFINGVTYENNSGDMLIILFAIVIVLNFNGKLCFD